MKTTLLSIRLLALLTLITGGLYPMIVWAAAQTFFPHAAKGSLLLRNGTIVGSQLLAQKTTGPHYFHPRPSATDYATLPSGGSNLAWSSNALERNISARKAAWSPSQIPPPDALTASGSGLDPDASPASIRMQAPRVAEARGFAPEQLVRLHALIDSHITGGGLSPARINVLALNLALDMQFQNP